ncbi:ABC transporter ATP-binding protein [Sphaerisporangium sp. TRM90804]|uniref:ABC transporter ATP-binding protein n=1 Tax=Sphaerisporangium sp. TRM90804 TaxID=3031113 RepID=UPI00244CF1CE|nr:ABC transporter ATP-binding protein [Sphaerisporangium sp. TRM90804]MDH2427196.1 ABC transporter ATP-binding protein [Sphaerisporangium sp. TRM90804]
MAETVISLTDLRKSYGSVTAVDGLDLRIERGQKVAILGPNGAGKSTLLNMVLGLLAPDSGELSVLGGSPKTALTKGRMGAMLQDGGLVDEVTVGEMARAMAALYPKARPVEDALAIAGLSELRDRRVGRLSGGQKQRVRFAMALVGDPELLIFDEPTVGMDVEGRRDFWKEASSLTAGGDTVIFATHYLAEADSYADRVVLLAKGRVVADGSIATIKSLVPFKVVECTLSIADVSVMNDLPGVTSARTRGERVILHSTDSDATLRALMDKYPDAHEFEVGGVDLEDAFVALTHGEG